jgi:hypothetical protein
MTINRIFVFFLATFLTSCSFFTPKPIAPVVVFNSEFEVKPKISPIEFGLVNEVSGIADSHQFPGHIWVEENGNRPDQIYLYNHDGQHKGTIKLPMKNYDWEDMVISNGPAEGKKYIYLADIGDNFGNRKEYQIYRFLEPSFQNGSVNEIDAIRFVYPDNANYDAEAIIVDHKTKDIYIFTKNLAKTKVFRLSYPQVSGTSVSTAEFIKDFPFVYITSAGLSADSQEIVLKNYLVLYYWHFKTDGTILSTIGRAPDKYQPYENEPQGEAFCFANDSKSYFIECISLSVL